jgi:hypothetical protein
VAGAGEAPKPQPKLPIALEKEKRANGALGKNPRES